ARGNVRLRTKLTLVAATVLIAGLLAYDCCFGCFWVGGFRLQVNVVPSGSREITRISAEALMLKEWAQYVYEGTDRVELRLEPVQFAAGKPFTVYVESSGERSAFGRDLGYFQYQLLVLRVEYADGTHEYVTAEIPDGRRQREMSVQVP